MKKAVWWVPLVSALASSSVFAGTTYRVHVKIDTACMIDAGVLSPSDWTAEKSMDSANGHQRDDFSHHGDASLEVVDLGRGSKIIQRYGWKKSVRPGADKSKFFDFDSPTWDQTFDYESDDGVVNLKFRLRDRDWLVVNPVSWFGGTDDLVDVGTVALDAKSSADQMKSAASFGLSEGQCGSVSVTKVDTGIVSAKNRTVPATRDDRVSFAGEKSLPAGKTGRTLPNAPGRFAGDGA